MIVIIIIVILCPNIIAFCSVKLDFLLQVIRNPASKSLQSIEISLYLAFTNEWNVAKKEKLLMNDLFYLEILFCWGKVNVVTSYSLNLDVNRCFWNPDLSVCKYDWSYYYWSLYCYLTIVMIWKYLKSDKSWSIVWIFAMAPNFSYFVQ
jgi:hypothetical protein